MINPVLGAGGASFGDQRKNDFKHTAVESIKSSRDFLKRYRRNDEGSPFRNTLCQTC